MFWLGMPEEGGWPTGACIWEGDAEMGSRGMGGTGFAVAVKTLLSVSCRGEKGRKNNTNLMKLNMF